MPINKYILMCFRTIPTFLLNKKRKKKSDDSDEDVKMGTPPGSPGLDDAFVSSGASCLCCRVCSAKVIRSV